MKELVSAFNQEKALEGAFSVIANLRMDLCFKLTMSVTCHLLDDDSSLLLTQRCFPAQCLGLAEGGADTLDTEACTNHSSASEPANNSPLLHK